MVSGNQILVKSASNIDSHIIIFSVHQRKNHTRYWYSPGITGFEVRF